MKKFLLFLMVFLGLGSVGLSYFKNDKIASVLRSKLDTVKAFKYDKITCDGFVKADCRIDGVAYMGKSLADSVTFGGIDPTVQFDVDNFKKIPLHAEVKGAKYSLFDISSMMKESVQTDLKDFFAKYTKDYDITIDALLATNGESVRSVEIVKLDAEDKITPFVVSGEVDKLDTFPVLKHFNAHFDFSKKREIFYDFLENMRACCQDKIPARYLKMSNEAIWNDVISQMTVALGENLHNQFNQDVETQFIKAMLVLLQDERNTLEVAVKSKKDIPLEQTVMQFFIQGPDAVKAAYDIQIKAN